MFNKTNEEVQDRVSKGFYLAIKVLVHLTVLSISALLTVNMFRSFSDVALYKNLYSLLALTIELSKLYVWVLAVAMVRRNEGLDRLVAGFLLVVYLGLAFVSLASNTGFSLSSISQQSFNAVVRNESADTIIIDREIAQLESDIDFLNNDRVLAQDKKKALPDNWSTKEQDLIIENTTEEIATRNNRINELLLLRQEATNQELILSSKASDIFTLLGQGKYEGSTVMLVLMMLIAILLECLTIITAGTYPLKAKKDSKEVAKVEPKQEAVEEIEVVTDLPVSTPKVAMTIDKKGILEYLDVMFEDGIAKLKNDIEISKKTGIKLNTCKAYRRQLLSMTYNNKSIIVAKKGKGTHSTMPLRSVKKLIQLEMNVEDK